MVTVFLVKAFVADLYELALRLSARAIAHALYFVIPAGRVRDALYRGATWKLPRR